MACAPDHVQQPDGGDLKPHVVVCGNVVWDVLVRPVAEPIHWGATELVDAVSMQMGGNASSTSYTLGKLGVTVSIASLLGDDSPAASIRERLASVGVKLDLLHVTKCPTSSAVCLVRADGSRALLYALGASSEEFSFPLALPADATHFHLAAVYRMRHLRAIGPDLLKLAKAAGLTTSLDTQWDTEGEWMKVLAPSLPHTDYTLLNEDEARMITGFEDPAEAAHILRDHGATNIVIKLGSNGCWVNGEVVPGFEVEAVDTTGAGDCFAGGFLAAKQRGFGDSEAALFANAVGALSVQSIGATAGLLDFDETLVWIAGRS